MVKDFLKFIIKAVVIMGLLLWAWSYNGYAQQIRGKVSNADGQPIAGVSITGKNKSINLKQTNTNEKGEYTLTDQDIDTVVFSHQGYGLYRYSIAQLRESNGQVTLRIKANDLAEVQVVNTGYQQLPRERTTGSFTLVDRRDYEQQVGTNALARLATIANGLVGVASSVGFFNQTQFQVRGLSSYTSSITKPLIIVDNFEYAGNLDNINPNDIEAVTILKDAAASSIWGAKAANGVIVLTTKKGRLGTPLTINLTANATVLEKPDLYQLPLMSSADQLELERFLFAQQYRFADTSRSTRPPFSEAYELLFANRAGRLSNAALEAQLAQMATRDIRDEYHRYFYQAGINQQYALSLRGGSANAAWSLSLGNDANKGVLDERYERQTLRLSNTIRLSQRISVEADIAYTASNNRNGRPAWATIKPNNSQGALYTTFTNPDGSPKPLYNLYRQGYTDNLGGGRLLDWKYYPLTDYQHQKATGKIGEFNLQLKGSYKILPWLTYSLSGRYQRQHARTESYADPESFLTRNLINDFTLLGATLIYRVPMGGILDWTETTVEAKNLRTQLQAAKNWTNQRFDILVGAEGSETISDSSADRVYGYNPATYIFTQADLLTRFSTLATGALNSIPNPRDFSGSNNRFLSYFATGAYSYLEKYTLSGSARRDASNLFGVLTNDKWNPLWSIGGLWTVDREKFFPKSPLEQLKLRATYGTQGNLDPSKVAVTTLAYSSNNPYTLTPFARINNNPNPELRWEKVKMLNVGLEGSLWQGRLGFSIEHYRKQLRDMYGNVPIDYTSGISAGQIVRNIGEGKGRGWDIQLRSNLKAGQFKLQNDLIVNTYNDEITKLRIAPTLASSAVFSGPLLYEGYSPSSIISYQWAGLDPLTGSPRSYLNGQVTSDANAIISQTRFDEIALSGNQLPRLFGSFGTTIAYQDLSLSFRLSYKWNYVFRRESLNYGSLITQLVGHSDYALRWQKPGDEAFTDVPSLQYPTVGNREVFYNASEALIERGEHIRLQLVQLNYRLSKARVHWMPVNGLDIFASGNNIGLVYVRNKRGLDPDFAGLRPARNLTFGLKLNY